MFNEFSIESRQKLETVLDKIQSGSTKLQAAFKKVIEITTKPKQEAPYWYPDNPIEEGHLNSINKILPTLEKDCNKLNQGFIDECQNTNTLMRSYNGWLRAVKERLTSIVTETTKTETVNNIQFNKL